MLVVVLLLKHLLIHLVAMVLHVAALLPIEGHRSVGNTAPLPSWSKSDDGLLVGQPLV